MFLEILNDLQELLYHEDLLIVYRIEWPRFKSVGIIKSSSNPLTKKKRKKEDNSPQAKRLFAHACFHIMPAFSSTHLSLKVSNTTKR